MVIICTYKWFKFDINFLLYFIFGELNILLMLQMDCIRIDIVSNDVFVYSGSDGRHAGGDLLEGEDSDRGGERTHRVGAAPRAAVRGKCPTPHSATRAICATRPLVPYLRTCLTPPVRLRIAATSPPPRIVGDNHRPHRTSLAIPH